MTATPPSDVFVEPTADATAGVMRISPMATSYERFMADQGIPVYEAPGFRDVRELELQPWSRIGGRAAFLVPDNTVDVLGMQVVEVAPGGSLEPQRGMFETKVYVVEGRGTTELWSTEKGARRRSFEWGPGTLFAVPMNVNYQIVNGSNREPARFIVGNTSPAVINTFDNLDFVFDNNYFFADRYSEDARFFSPDTTLRATPETKRAMWRTNVIGDIATCELPLDNQRSPGYRRIEPHMAGGYFWSFVGEHQPGRYSKAHAHESGAVLICVRGEGYTLNWPIGAGPRPWVSGAEDQVERVDYVAGGLVAAAPGGGEWFHQHFGSGAGPLRFLVFYGGAPGTQYADYRERRGEARAWLNADVEEGGRSIGYRNEDPYVRQAFEASLREAGIESTMLPSLYE